MSDFVERRRQPSFMDRWKEVIISAVGFLIAGALAWGALDAKVCKLQEETSITRIKLDRIADDVSYMRGQWDNFGKDKKQ